MPGPEQTQSDKPLTTPADRSEITEIWFQSGGSNGCSLEWWLDQNNRTSLLKEGLR
jgi:hypothetical protein